MRNMLLIDLDGTIRRSKSGSKFINDPEDQEPIPGAIQSLEKFDRVFGISNQAGVFYKHKTFSDCQIEQYLTLCLFPKLDSIYFCPDRGDYCFKVIRIEDGFKCFEYSRDSIYQPSFRKPSPGMLNLAMLENEISSDEVLYVGDRIEDKLAAENACIPFVWSSFFLR